LTWDLDPDLLTSNTVIILLSGDGDVGGDAEMSMHEAVGRAVGRTVLWFEYENIPHRLMC
jgi:hypothetical protein